MSNKKTQDVDSYEEFDEGEKTNHNNNSHKNDILAIQNIMRTENGRNWIWQYLQSCLVFESTFNSDTIQASYNAGLRDAGLKIERELKEYALSDYLKMIKESFDE